MELLADNFFNLDTLIEVYPLLLQGLAMTLGLAVYPSHSASWLD